MEFKRFIAFIIDIFMSAILFIPLCICFILLEIELKDSMIPILIWEIIFCKDCFGGRSIGKRILGYQVIDSNTGQVARPFKCAFRNLFYILGAIDIVAMLYHSKGLRLGEYITHTQVNKYNNSLKKNRWIEAVLTIVCVFSILLIIYTLLTHYASSLGLFGRLYQ